MTLGRKTYPDPPVVLSAESGARERPRPVEGCGLCAHLAGWHDHFASVHDLSAAVDCAVEIRNHPHEPRRMSVPAASPPRRGKRSGA